MTTPDTEARERLEAVLADWDECWSDISAGQAVVKGNAIADAARALLTQPQPAPTVGREEVARVDEIRRLALHALEEWPSPPDARRDLCLIRDEADRLRALLQPEGEGGAGEGDTASKLLTYEQAHEAACALGYPSITEALEALDDRDQEVRRLREVVEWYANRAHYTKSGVAFEMAAGGQSVRPDRGTRARAALSDGSASDRATGAPELPRDGATPNPHPTTGDTTGGADD